MSAHVYVFPVFEVHIHADQYSKLDREKMRAIQRLPGFQSIDMTGDFHTLFFKQGYHTEQGLHETLMLIMTGDRRVLPEIEWKDIL
jgi:hypothetical protein